MPWAEAWSLELLTSTHTQVTLNLCEEHQVGARHMKGPWQQQKKAKAHLPHVLGGFNAAGLGRGLQPARDPRAHLHACPH